MENNTNPNENTSPNMNPVQPENNDDQFNQVVQNTPSATETKTQSGFGPIIGLIIILVIILIGGIYYFININNNGINNLPVNNVDTSNNIDVQETPITEDVSTVIETQDSSDDLDSIEADLNSFGGAEIDQATAY